MKTIGGLLLLLLVAAAAGYGGYRYAHRHGGEMAGEETATTQPAEEEKPVVPVTTAPIARRTITETATAYGTVTTQPGATRVISVPFESRVVRVPVAPGQSVSPDTEVVHVEASPDALVTLKEAQNAAEAAARDLKQMERRFADHLATNLELSTAQQASAAAKLKLDSLVQRGVGKPHDLKAGGAGIIGKVNVQEGQIVPAGGSLVEVAASDRIEVRLGVDPADAESLRPDQSISLRQTDRTGTEPITGRIRLVERRIDPATRLVPVAVSLPPDAHLLLDTFVTGEVTRRSADALVVPRDAAIPGDDGTYSVYTVKDGHAIKHAVRVGLQDDHDVQILSDDLKEGEPVVVTGNYLLADGMDVDVKETATEPAGPATRGAATTETEAKQ